MDFCMFTHDMSHLKPPDTVFFQPAGCEPSSEAEAKSLHHDLRRAEDADGLIQSGGPREIEIAFSWG